MPPAKGKTQARVSPQRRNRPKMPLRPFRLVEGVIIAVVAVVFSIVLASFLAMHYKANQELVIKSATYKQTVAVVAGQPIQGTVLINKSDITNKKYLLQLPKGARNIKINTISAIEAKTVLATPPVQQLSLGQRVQLAEAFSKNQNFLSRATSSLYADLSATADSVVQTIAGNVGQLNVLQTVDSTVVNLADNNSPTDVSSLVDASVTDTATPTDQSSVTSVSSDQNSVVQVTYEAPAPVITEQPTDTGKVVTVSDPGENPASPVTDVVASTKIPEIFKVGQESSIHIKWTNNGNQNVTFHAYDTNGNGYLDYVEWTVPHLSDQTFEIIYISKAFQLDSNQNILSDIYPETETQDGNYASIPDGNYIRATFNEVLDKNKDITLYAKATNSNQPGSVEVYPVYTDGSGNQTEGNQLALVPDGQNADFSNIVSAGKYRILLKNLQTPTDTFDLKISGGVDVDYIVDPSGYYTCYQEDADSTTSGSANGKGSQVNGSCGLVATGSNYVTSGGGFWTCNSGSGNGATHDGDWSGTLCLGNVGTSSDNIVNITYAYPTAGTPDQTHTVWKVQDDYTMNHGGAINLTIDSACWTYGSANGNKLYLRIDSYATSAGASLEGGTFVSTVSGQVQIKNIKTGDLVYSYNDTTQKVELRPVQSVTSKSIGVDGDKYYYIYTSSGNLIKATSNHQFYVNGSYVNAENLKVGEKLFTQQLTAETITKINVVKNITDRVWDLTVAGNHNFFANNILVHNNNNDTNLSTIQNNGGTIYSCQTGSSTWTDLETDTTASSAGYIYEEAMNWAITDTTPPSGGSITYNNGYTTTASVSLTGSDGTDSGAGIDTTSRIFKRDSATLSAGSCGAFPGTFSTTVATGSTSFTDTSVSSGNCYQYEYLVSDLAGNQATYTSTNVVKVDTVAPSVSDNVPSSWQKTNPTITLTCTDSASGCNQVFYTTDGSTPATSTSSFVNASSSWQFTYTTETSGAIVKYFGQDLAGNLSAVQTATNQIKLDKTAPTNPGTPSASSPTNNNKPTWSWTASTDSGSGLATPKYSVKWCSDSGFTTNCSTDTTSLTSYAPTASLADGTWYFEVQAADVAGNTSNWSQSTGVVVDATAPTVSAGANVTAKAQFTKSDATASDSGSGVSTYAWTKQAGTGTITFGSASALSTTISSDTDGVFTIRLTVTDVAGNSSHSDFTLTWDTTAPTGSVVVQSPDGYTDYTDSTSATLEISASDSGSGLSQMEVSEDSGFSGASYVSYATSLPFTLSSGDGTKTVYIRFKDVAGNVSSGYSATIVLDTVLPVATANATTADSATYTGDWTNQAVSVSITCSDDNSGCEGVYSCFDTTGNGCDPTADPSPASSKILSYTSDTNGTVFWAVDDNAGNWSSTGSLPIKIDQGVPDEGLTHQIPPVGTQWRNTNYVLNFTCDDHLGSGCKLLQLCWDRGTTCDPNSPDVTITQGVSDNTASYTFTSDINTTARWKFQDNAGNWSNTFSQIVQIDKTPPSNSIASVNVVSTSEIDAAANTASDGSGIGFVDNNDNPISPYQFKMNSTALGWQTGKTINETGLSPNTQYAFSVETQDGVGNVSGYSSPTSKYTFANAPTGLVLSAGETQITATWNANGNPDGTQYYIEDPNNTSDNSGWTTASSWAFLGLKCATSYTFHVKAENGDNIATSYSSTQTITTSDCSATGGGGGTFAGSTTATTPTSELVLLINGGALTSNSPSVALTLQGPTDATKMMISEDSNFKTGVINTIYKTSFNFTLSDGNGQKTVYVKFLNAAGDQSQVISQNITLKASVSIPDKITNLTKNLSQGYQSTVSTITNQIQSIQNIIGTTPSTPTIQYPPIEQSVPKQAPVVFQNPWQQILAEPVSNFANNPLPREFSDIVVKFPGLDKTLQSLGINGVGDIAKIKAAQLILPTLTEAVIPQSNATNLSQTNIPLSDLTPIQKQNIPNEVVFARSGEGLLDLNTVLTIDPTNQLQQRINAVSGQNLELVVKPKGPAASVIGYVIFKSKLAAGLNDNKIKDPYMAALSNAIAILQSQSEVPQQNLVLDEFQYIDKDHDGIYTADVQTPLVGGNYQISTVINYQDKSLGSKTLNMTTVVDPEGYVFTNTGAGEVRISGAKVSLYWLNPSTQKYEMWPAKNYRQENPQITDATGIYSFLVPPGTYYLSITSDNYDTYKGDPFVVDNGNSITINVGLNKKFYWKDLVSWQSIAILLLIILIFTTLFKNKLIIPQWKTEKSY